MNSCDKTLALSRLISTLAEMQWMDPELELASSRFEYSGGKRPPPHIILEDLPLAHKHVFVGAASSTESPQPLLQVAKHHPSSTLSHANRNGLTNQGQPHLLHSRFLGASLFVTLLISKHGPRAVVPSSWELLDWEKAQVKRDGLLKQHHKDALTELNHLDTGEDKPILSSESRLG